MAITANLASLPIEIKAAILGEPEFPSIPALAVVNSGFYAAYKEFKAAILYYFAAKAMGRDLNWAVAAQNACLLRKTADEFSIRLPDNSNLFPLIRAFGDKYLDHTPQGHSIDKSDFTYFTYGMVTEMIKLHLIVQEWALKYTALSLSLWNPSMYGWHRVCHGTKGELREIGG